MSDFTIIEGDVTLRRSDGTEVGTITNPLYVRDREDATFTVSATAVALANNKSLISIFNADASRKVRIHAIWLVNVQTVAITGVVVTFELRRLTGAVPSVGTDLTTTGVEQLDTADAKDADWTVRTGATVGTEATKLLRRVLWSSDERGTATLDQEGYDHAVQATVPIWDKRNGSLKPIVLRQNEGITVKCATNTTAGTWDIFAIVSEEA